MVRKFGRRNSISYEVSEHTDLCCVCGKKSSVRLRAYGLLYVFNQALCQPCRKDWERGEVFI